MILRLPFDPRFVAALVEKLESEVRHHFGERLAHPLPRMRVVIAVYCQNGALDARRNIVFLSAFGQPESGDASALNPERILPGL